MRRSTAAGATALATRRLRAGRPTSRAPSPRTDEASCAARCVAGGGDPIQAEVGDSDHEVAQREDNGRLEAARQVAPRPGDRQHQHEHGHHHDDERHADDAFVSLGLVAEPRVADPAPPHEGEHHETASEPFDADIAGHQRRGLGERVDEHEIEEQFQRSHLGVLGDTLRRRSAQVFAHRRQGRTRLLSLA